MRSGDEDEGSEEFHRLFDHEQSLGHSGKWIIDNWGGYGSEKKSFIDWLWEQYRTQVSRRYKHFDWLHEILTAKYITIALPPLPEKQVSGEYGRDGGYGRM